MKELPTPLNGTTARERRKEEDGKINNQCYDSKAPNTSSFIPNSR
jgi:hypothetical protein